MPGRSFKNERQVDLDSLGTNFPGVQTIIKRRMRFWFNELSAFRRHAVVEFYTNMVIHLGVEGEGNERIESKVGRKNIVVTPNLIAKYLGYRRPRDVEYPGNIFPIELLVEELYENPEDYHGVFRPGYFKEEYRLLNKVLQANFFPRVSGHRLTHDFAVLLYFFNHLEFYFDCTLWIFNQLVDFKAKANVASNIPFPCMISHFCISNGVRGGLYELTKELEPGPIDKQGMSKSQSLSKPIPKVDAPSSSCGVGSSRASVRPKSTIKDLLRSIFCQTSTIRADQKEIKKRQIRLEKKQDRTMFEVAWQTKQIENSTNSKFVPPEEDEEEEDEESEEQEMPLMSDSYE